MEAMLDALETIQGGRGLRPAQKRHNWKYLGVAVFSVRAEILPVHIEYLSFTYFSLQHDRHPPQPMVKIRSARIDSQENKLRTNWLIRKFFRFCDRC
jgi:hypothetical protein